MKNEARFMSVPCQNVSFSADKGTKKERKEKREEEKNDGRDYIILYFIRNARVTATLWHAVCS
ncbi:MAG: hypothetical protein IJQ59_00885 [Bacteroidaceae bacterium]|nr:hypothetical protein [Bacteroidaceae bacterium]